MRNITNTFENVSNRNISNSILTNSLKAINPLILSNDGLDDVISLKGLSSLGTSNQYLRMKSDATGLEFISLTFVDLNSTETLTNKTLSSGCSYTGNAISKTYLDNTLVDTTATQTVSNKALTNSSLNYNAGMNTQIGTNTTNSYIYGILNLDSGNNRSIIRLNNDFNHSIYLRKNLANVDNRIAFYEFGEFEFYTGNGSNINQAQMVKRLSISHTALTSTVEIVCNDIKPRNIYLRENVADNGNNYINIKAPEALSSNFTLNVKGEDGTIALTTDIPTATLPLSISNKVISLGGLSNFGNSGQVITSTGNAFTYTTLNNLTANDVRQIIQNHSDISTFTGTGLDSTDTTLGNGSGSNPRETNINGKNITLNASTTQTKLQIGGSDKFILNTSLLLSKTQLLVSSTASAVDDSNTNFEVNSDAFTKMLIKSTASNNACELAFKSNNQQGNIQYSGATQTLEFNTFLIYDFKVVGNRRLKMDDTTFFADFTSDYDFKIGGNSRLKINNTTLTLDPTTNMSLKINNSTKLALTSTLTTLTGDTVRMSNGSGFTRLEIQNALTYSVNPLLISSASTSLDGISPNLEVQQTGAVCKFLVSSSNNIAQIYLKSGSNFGSLEFTNSGERFFTSGMRIIDFLVWNGSTNTSKFVIEFDNTTVKNRLRVQYDDPNSLIELDSGSANPKIGLHMINTSGSSNVESKLFYDFGGNNLVYNSPADDATGQRFQINGTNPTIVYSNGRSLIFRSTSGNHANYVQIGNAVDNVKINSGNHILVDTPLDMNFKKVRFKDQGDDNHYIHHTTFDSIDGPAVGGWDGVGVFTKYGLAYRAKNDGTTPKLCAPNGMSCNSDDRIKFNEVPVINAIDTIKKLKPVFYNKASALDYTGITSTLPTEYGFIAQDTYNNVPELRQSVIFNKTLPINFVNEDLNNNCVEDIYNQTTNSDGITSTYRDVCGFNYDNLHAINVKAIQELLLEIELLKNRISQLELASS